MRSARLRRVARPARRDSRSRVRRARLDRDLASSGPTCPTASAYRTMRRRDRQGRSAPRAARCGCSRFRISADRTRSAADFVSGRIDPGSSIHRWPRRGAIACPMPRRVRRSAAGTGPGPTRRDRIWMRRREGVDERRAARPGYSGDTPLVSRYSFPEGRTSTGLGASSDIVCQGRLAFESRQLIDARHSREPSAYRMRCADPSPSTVRFRLRADRRGSAAAGEPATGCPRSRQASADECWFDRSAGRGRALTRPASPPRPRCPASPSDSPPASRHRCAARSAGPSRPRFISTSNSGSTNLRRPTRARNASATGTAGS